MGDEQDAAGVGGGGIDGIISLDRLGQEKVEPMYHPRQECSRW
ncbi:MAG TPA: hypothetical protein VER33_14255 [Polyangiaceae bacterium]|nr:hypothetical protein [Polyangiaceae bacterium]